VDRSGKKKLAIAAAVLVWLVVTPFTWRDLRRRGPEEIRGPKWLWWIASANLSGSVLYWLLGRTETR
jgi:hypothetical protein